MVAMARGSLLCPVLIGRAEPVRALRRFVDEALQGGGRTVLISGEAGIGKTRLVAETAAYATGRGFRLVRGSCFEPDRICPYAPILDLLRGHPDGVAALGVDASALYPLLPDLAPPPAGSSPPPLGAEQERRRIFAVLVRLVLRLAERKPLLLVVEDLHWSDDVSLEWLHLLMRRLGGHPLLLVLTYRGDEAGPNLQHWLARLDRERLAEEIPLAPLTPTEVEAMLSAVFALPRPVGRDFRDAIYELSQGNPFVVEELLASLVAAGGVVHADGVWTRKPIARLRIPRSVADAVQQRRARLGGEARRLLDLAAVAGRRFDVAVLREVTGHDEPSLLALIKELIAAQLVVEESADHIAFRHAVTREAVYADLLTWERRGMHRSLAEATARLDAGSREPRVADLAHHFFAAGAWAEAVAYAEFAGRRALALHAPAAAVEHLSQAIAAAHQLGRAPSPALFRERGQAHDLLGDFAAAEADFAAALAAAETTGDRVAAWHGLLDLGFLWTSRDYDHAHGFLQRALDLARGMDDPARLAHSLNRMGNWHANHEEPDAARLQHEEALAIFEGIGDRAGVAASLDLLSMAFALNGDMVAAASAARRAAPLFEALDDRRGLSGSLANATMTTFLYEGDTLVGSTNTAGPIEPFERALAITREIGWRAGESYALSTLAQHLATTGEFGRALVLLRESEAIAEEIEHRQWMVQSRLVLACLHGNLLAWPLARGYAERAREVARQIGSPFWLRATTGGLASILVQDGNLVAAGSLLAAMGPEIPRRSQAQRGVWAARAELALAAGDPETALAIADDLYAAAANLTSEAEIPRLARLKAEALVGLGRRAAAATLLDQAISFTAAGGARAALWPLLAGRAALHRAVGRLDAAEGDEDAARVLIAELGQRIDDAELGEGFRRRALAVLSPPSGTASRRAERIAAGGLTAREREVAVRIAAGATNRAIADALSVSERTVETHVGNILHKLGFATRSQIAAWDVTRGMAATT